VERIKKMFILLFGICFGILFSWYGLSAKLFVGAVFLILLGVVAGRDIKTFEIPNEYVLWIAILGIIAIFVFPEIRWTNRVAGIFCVSLILLLITVIVPGSFGGGDIKLMAACGAFLGGERCLIAFGIAVMLGGIWGIVLLISGKKKAKESIAFGPFLCVGSAISFLCGEALIRWYLGG